MAITDIQISEELETNAPSIKYRGNEGPKSPQEMEQMADAMLREEYEQYLYDLEEQKPGFPPMSFEEFKRMAIGEGQMSGGQPLPQEMKQMADMDAIKEGYSELIFGKPLDALTEDEILELDIILKDKLGGPFSGGQPLPQDPTKPVNPFAPKPTGPVLPDRQMAAYGGIMGLDGRKRYGIGSWFQEEIMDPIKKNPVVSSLVGGALVNQFGIPFTGTPGNRVGQNWIGDLLGKRDSVLGKGMDKVWDKESRGMVDRKKLFNIGEFLETPTNKSKEDSPTYGEAIRSSIGRNIIPAAGGIMAGLFTKGGGQDASTMGMPSDNTAMNIQNLTKTANLLDQKQGLAAGMNFLPAVSARKFTPEEMAIAYSQEAANGGRIGFANGGGLMDLGGMEKDYRAEGGFVPIGAKEKADDVPARLSVNEFVFTADAVRNAGGGDIDEGAKVMENMMKHLEAGGQVSEESQGMGGAREMFETSERLSEVI